MPGLSYPLKILILQRDTASADLLQTVLRSITGVESVILVAEAVSALEILRQDTANTVFIDLFSEGITEGVSFVRTVRSRHPEVPFCLYSSREKLLTLPDVPDEWKQRFDHYFKLPSDLPLQGMRQAAEEILLHLSTYLLTRVATSQLVELRTRLTGTHPSGVVSESEARYIDSVTSTVERALRSQVPQRPTQNTLVLLGIGVDQVNQHFADTLNQSQHSLRLHSYANLAILIVGGVLVVGSFVVAITTGNFAVLGFGGLGIAGVITSLIRNPLRSIGQNAFRLIHLRIAYLSFLNQAAMLTTDLDRSNIMERCRMLGEETRKAEEALAQYFGEDSAERSSLRTSPRRRTGTGPR